jgi:hypothetical protein
MIQDEATLLIARFMEHTITAEEIKALDQWLEATDDNIQLFGTLINKRNAVEARKWFADLSVDNKALEHIRPSERHKRLMIKEALKNIFTLEETDVPDQYCITIYLNGNNLQRYKKMIIAKDKLTYTLKKLKQTLYVGYEINENQIFIKDL